MPVKKVDYLSTSNSSQKNLLLYAGNSNNSATVKRA